MVQLSTPAGVFYTTGAVITGTVQGGSTAVTATTALNHGLVVGQQVRISGSDVSAHNGEFLVAAAEATTTFVYVISGSATANGGPASVLGLTPEFRSELLAGNNIQFTKKGTKLEITGSADANGNTLDQAYDSGGAGSGRTIVANNGAVAITVADGSNNNALEITQSDDSNNKHGILVTMGGTGRGLLVKGASNDAATIQLENDDASRYLVLTQPDGAAAQVISSGLLALVSDGGEGIVLNPDTGGTPADVTIQPGSKGLTIGNPPSHDFDGGSFNMGDNQQATTLGVTIGAANSVIAGPGIAIGQACTVQAAFGIALGIGATTNGFHGKPSLCMSDGTAAGGGFSTNTLVLDSGDQHGSGSPGSGSGPVGGGGSAGAVALAGSPGRGNIYLETGTIFSGSADYAELFEWADGNSNSTDRRGLFVSLTNGNKITVGGSDPIGVMSSRPVIIGDAASLGWRGQYLLDEFGATQKKLRDGVYAPIPNPNYNPTQVYVPRLHRKEWSPVGLLGKLYVRTAPLTILRRTVNAGTKCTSNSLGYAVRGNKYHVLRVMRAATATKYGIVEILLK